MSKRECEISVKRFEYLIYPTEFLLAEEDFRNFRKTLVKENSAQNGHGNPNGKLG